MIFLLLVLSLQACVWLFDREDISAQRLVSTSLGCISQHNSRSCEDFGLEEIMDSVVLFSCQ